VTESIAQDRQSTPNDTSRQPPALIRFRDVNLTVAESKPILSDISFDVRTGETLVLLGRSGSGKTTTLKLINRLLEPTSGEVSISDKPTTSWDPIKLRRRIGYVIQEIGLFPHFTIEQNVALVPALEGWDQPRIRERVRELLELVGLEPSKFAARLPRELSGGQRQRVGVARALAADPPIILMDEPFGALDPLTRSELQREFASLVKRLNKTIVFVTHDVREAFLLASRIGLFKDGRLVELATPDNFAQSTDAEARAFVQTMNEETRRQL
jgi:osmoprotectant transport system ATP-binding protein